MVLCLGFETNEDGQNIKINEEFKTKEEEEEEEEERKKERKKEGGGHEEEEESNIKGKKNIRQHPPT